MRAISQEIPHPWITKQSLKITYLNLHLNPPGTVELPCRYYCLFNTYSYHAWYVSKGRKFKYSHTSALTCGVPENYLSGYYYATVMPKAVSPNKPLHSPRHDECCGAHRTTTVCFMVGVVAEFRGDCTADVSLFPYHRINMYFRPNIGRLVDKPMSWRYIILEEYEVSINKSCRLSMRFYF